MNCNPLPTVRCRNRRRNQLLDLHSFLKINTSSRAEVQTVDGNRTSVQTLESPSIFRSCTPNQHIHARAVTQGYFVMKSEVVILVACLVGIAVAMSHSNAPTIPVNPNLFEISTRPWLYSLSQKYGRNITKLNGLLYLSVVVTQNAICRYSTRRVTGSGG